MRRAFTSVCALITSRSREGGSTDRIPEALFLTLIGRGSGGDGATQGSHRVRVTRHLSSLVERGTPEEVGVVC